MPETALGAWLRGLREDNDLSLRDLAQRSEVDHAYIYRLETGAKESPSGDVINKLDTALSLAERDSQILRFLSANPNIDVKYVEFVRTRPDVTFPEFHTLTTVVNRGAQPDLAKSLIRVRALLAEDDDG